MSPRIASVRWREAGNAQRQLSNSGTLPVRVLPMGLDRLNRKLTTPRWLGASAATRLRMPGRGDLLVISFCVLALGNLWARRGAGNVDVGPSAPAFVLGFALIVMAGALSFGAIGRPHRLPRPAVAAGAIALLNVFEPTYMFTTPVKVAVGLFFAAALLVRRSFLRWGLISCGVLVSALAVANVWRWGWASMDVFTEVQGAAAALLHGQNPYSSSYTVLLSWAHGRAVFGTSPFCYGPVVVLLSIPSRLLGDVRLTALALNLSILGAALVWTHRNAPAKGLGTVVTALWAASPFVPFMVLTEWTDTFCVAGFAWWLVLRDRQPRWATLILALGLASKPSVVLLLLPMLIWVETARRQLIWALAGALMILAPFALWTGIPQFFYDTVGVFTDLPVRTDGVTVDGLSFVLGNRLLPGWTLAAGIALSVTLFASRRPRDYGAMLVAGAGLVVFVCLFGKQAFLNYYFIAAVAMLLAIGAGESRPAEAICSPIQQFTRDVRRLRRHQVARA